MITMIACMSLNNVIGLNGKLPWHIPEDLKRFKKITTGNTIVMGRKTFESVGVLPNRDIIVMSRTKYDVEGVTCVQSVQEVLSLAKARDVFICGGAQIYELFLDKADRLMLTWWHYEIDGDAYFPELRQEDWICVDSQWGGDKHRYITLERDYDA